MSITTQLSTVSNKSLRHVTEKCLLTINCCISNKHLSVAKIMYCAPAWTGICSAADWLRLDRFLNRCKRIGFCATDLPSVTELHSDADDALFETIMTNSVHILQPYLPERNDLSYNLRDGSHNRSLITKITDLTDRDFLIRMLYKFAY